MRAGLVLVAALLAAPLGAARLTVELAPRQITVGDRVEAKLSVELPRGSAAPDFPSWSGGWGEAEVIEAGPVAREETASGVRFTQRLLLTAFKPGAIPLPAPKVRMAGSALEVDGALELTVRSVLPTGEEKLELQPPRPPLPLPGHPAFWWLAATLAGLGLAAAGAVVELARRQRRAEVAAAPLPPLAELQSALAALPGRLAPAEAHAALSLALRRFVARRLGFHAVESTTTEIQRELAARPFDRALARRTVELLRDCDAVKFARRPTSFDELSTRLAVAAGLAEETERHLAPPPPPAAEAAA